MAAAIKTVFGTDGYEGRIVAVQGVGSVGLNLVKRLLECGAKVYVTDIFPEKVQRAVEMGATAVPSEQIYDVECDIFAPCALGAVINDETLPRLRCKIVCGAANNQLHEPRHGNALAEKGILYAPDFIANGGGVINVADELNPAGYSEERALGRVSRIYDIAMQIFAMSKEKGIGTHEAADLYAEQRINKALLQKRLYLPK
jgi:leucine dehydrogenase